jgi:glycosyltransferase involved in cell wall biosynthesis
MAELGSAGRLALWLIRHAESYLLRRSDHVVVIHERFAKIVVEEFGVLREDVTVIQNWAHNAQLESWDRAKVRADFGLSPDDFIAMHTGNMGQKQGLENLVKAAELAIGIAPRLIFILVGDGTERSRLQDLASGLSNFQIWDSVDDSKYAALLSAADCLILNESVGVLEMAVPSKLTSYFSSGTPVVAAVDKGSISASVVELSGSGVIVESGDPVALLNSLLALPQSTEELAAMGARGVEYAQKNLSSAAALERFKNVLTQIQEV